MAVRENCKWCISTHGTDCLCTFLCHRIYGILEILVGISKCLLKSCPLLVCILLNSDIWNLQISEMYKIAVYPLSVRLCQRVFLLDFLIRYKTSIHCVDKKHLARSESVFLYDLGWIYVQNSDLRRKYKVIIICYIVSRWSKSISIKNCSHELTVCK